MHQIVIETEKLDEGLHIRKTEETPPHYVLGMLYEALLGTIEKVYETNPVATMTMSVTMMEGMHKLLKELSETNKTLQ